MSHIDDGRALLEELEAVKKDRDEWKEACMDANVRFKDAEEKLRTAYPLSDTLRHWKERAGRAEARLREAEMQRPYGYLHFPLGRMPDFHFKPDAHVGMEPVYIRPTPPTDVAETRAFIDTLQLDIQHKDGHIAELEHKIAAYQAYINSIQRCADCTVHPLQLDQHEELNKLLAQARKEGRREAVPDGWQVVPKEHAYRQLKFLEVLKDIQSTPAQQPEMKK